MEILNTLCTVHQHSFASLYHDTRYGKVNMFYFPMSSEESWRTQQSSKNSRSEENARTLPRVFQAQASILGTVHVHFCISDTSQRRLLTFSVGKTQHKYCCFIFIYFFHFFLSTATLFLAKMPRSLYFKLTTSPIFRRLRAHSVMLF